MSDLVAEAEAELYTADPDGFTGRRAELAARAREAGAADAAKRIASLRKPTRSAWVVNRLVRADPAVRTTVAEMSADLRAAGSAGGARIRALTAARARLVDELTRQALQVAGLSAPPAALREEVTSTLDAAIADPRVAADLGTLARAAQWAGFGPVPDGGFGPPPAPSPRAKTPKARTPAPAEATAEGDRRRREKIDEAERTLAEATQAAHAAAAAEQAWEDTVRRLEAELADARQRLAEERRQSYRAESRQRRASQALGRLRQ